MNEQLTKLICAIGITAISAAVYLLLAFPLMWCWNYAIVSVFNMPVITWGKAWCIMMVANWLIQSHLYNIK